MKPLEGTTGSPGLAVTRSRDLLALTKPELTFLSVLTAVAGFLMGAGPAGSALPLIGLIVGTLLVGGGAGALNQLAERPYDALMHRTAHRPLPAGRLTPQTALAFGLLACAAGLTVLTLAANPLTALLGMVTLILYIGAYTPMKRFSPAATLVGAVPGALPPVMGWTAAHNTITLPAWLLFALLFCWQIPHFLSLAWMYRRDYERAGYRLLTVSDPTGHRTALVSLFFLLPLVPVSIWLAGAGELGTWYTVGAVAAGGGYMIAGIAFLASRTNGAARRLFFASLFYFPALFLFLIADRVL